MVGSLRQYFGLYEFPAGRCLIAMRELAERAGEADEPHIVALAEQAIAQAQEAVELEAGWRRSKRTTEGRRVLAGQIDVKLDRTLGGIAAQLSALVHAFGEEEPGPKASALLERLFPEGASAITTMTYENELAASEVVLRDLNKHQADLAVLGLTSHVKRLEQLLPAFRDALKRESSREVGFDAVREARAQMQEAMLRVVCRVLGDYCGSAPEQVETRQSLLAPVMNQNRRIREARSNRRPVDDVDPETNEEAVAAS